VCRVVNFGQAWRPGESSSQCGFGLHL